MISTLIFDFGGVLIDLDRQRCIEAFRRLGLHNIDTMIDNYVQSGIFKQLENGDISVAQFHDGVRQLTGKAIPDDDIDRALNAFLVGIPPERLQLLRQLRPHYRLLLLSNTNAIHFPHSADSAISNDGSRLSDFFDRCYLSYEVHLSKPDPEFFRYLLEKEHLVPEECLFLDDGAKNIETAKSLGINTILVPERADLYEILKKYL